MTENQITNCPICPRGCPTDAPNCGRGIAFAEQLATDPAKAMAMAQSTKKRHGRHGGHGMGDDQDSLYSLLRRCGHALHHDPVSPEDVAAKLTTQDQETLKELLKKVLSGLE